MKSAVTLIQNNSYNTITVEVEVNKANTSKLTFEMQDLVNCKLKAYDSKLSLEAIKAASLSGALYAMRSVDGQYKINIYNVIYKTDTQDLTMCATAVALAVIYAIDKSKVVTDDLIGGWRLSEYKLFETNV